jgi:hypothetical protein
VDGDTVLVGAMLHSTGALSNNGAAYAFGMSSGRWQQLAEISASDAVSGGSFGQSVANQNGTLVIGAPGQHPSDEGYSAGELYVYQLRN